jgi:hypothetical protein
MIFYNPYLRLEENSSSVEISVASDYRKVWHSKLREDAYKNASKQAEPVRERRLILEDLEERYFL